MPDLPAKPIIDVQRSVAQLEPSAEYRYPLESLKLIFRADNQDRMKRYLHEAPGTRAPICMCGCWQLVGAVRPPLARLSARADPQAAAEYAALKQQRAARYRHDRQVFSAARGLFIWQVMQRADQWVKTVGWEPTPDFE